MPPVGRDAAPLRLDRATFGVPPGAKRSYTYRFEREPSGTTETLRAVYMHKLSGDPTIVVGDGGTALVRDPKRGWTREATGTNANLYAVTFAPSREDDPRNGPREERAHIAVGARGAALVRSADGVWRAEQTGTDKDLFGAFTQGANVLAVGAGGTMVQRSPAGVWRTIPTRTTVDLYAMGSCEPHVCAVGAQGMVVDCAGEGEALVCIPRAGVASGDLRVIADYGFLFGRGAPLVPARRPEGMASAPPIWEPAPSVDSVTVAGDDMRGAFKNNTITLLEIIAVGRGGVVWLLSRPSFFEKPFVRVTLPFGVDLNGVAYDAVDGFLVGDKGTIVHLAVDGVDEINVCVL
jgi:hypothetical protein